MKNAVRVAATVIVATLAFITNGVDGSATIKLQMTEFSNPSGLCFDGSGCDYLSSCDHDFRFSLDSGSSNDDPTGHAYWTQLSSHFQDQNINRFGADIAGVNNPIVYQFSDRWPGSIKFKLRVDDDDTPYTADDYVDGLIQLIQTTPAQSLSTASWTTVVVRGIRSRDKTSLTMSYMVYCDANYFSGDCNVYCVASDSVAGGHYTCDPATGNKVCRSGWEDASNLCKTPSNDCIVNACQNGATCVDGVRSYSCACPPGYAGSYCQTNINECASNPCQNGGTCVDGVNSFQCTCPPAFVGTTCSTVYCQVANPCRNGGVCYGAGLCQCPAAFTGSDCSVDRCQTVNCRNGASCLNGVCQCPPSFTGPSCDLVQCGNSQYYCLNGGVCFNGSCNCARGFTGVHCELNVDDCEPNPCQNNGTCTDLINGFICTCTPSFVGPSCSQPFCQSNSPCLNGGTCYGAGLCRCPRGFLGADCSSDRCELLSCRNGGSCASGLCVCPPGVIGETCDVVLCGIMKCLNGGSCNAGTCLCPSGYSGSQCEVNVDDCVGDHCQHDGTCDDLVDGFQCRCLPGFTGLRCQDIVTPPDANVTNSTQTLVLPYVADQPSSGMDHVEAWFIASFPVIFLLLIIIIILAACLCRQRRSVAAKANYLNQSIETGFSDMSGGKKGLSADDLASEPTSPNSPTSPTSITPLHQQRSVANDYSEALPVRSVYEVERKVDEELYDKADEEKMDHVYQKIGDANTMPAVPPRGRLQSVDSESGIGTKC